jgi:hypothetical protein
LSVPLVLPLTCMNGGEKSVAEIRKIARRPELSAFQQVAPTGGSATLLALAETMQAAYERLRPAGLKQMEDEAAAEWTGQARRDMGNPAGAFTASTKDVSGHDETGSRQDPSRAAVARGADDAEQGMALLCDGRLSFAGESRVTGGV